MALSKEGKIHQWDLVTGKLLPMTTLKTEGMNDFLKDYEVYTWTDEVADKTDLVYSKGWYNKILLKKKIPEPEVEKVDRKLFHLYPNKA